MAAYILAKIGLIAKQQMAKHVYTIINPVLNFSFVGDEELLALAEEDIAIYEK